MKQCQIALVGENINWITQGVMHYSIQKLILFTTPTEEFRKKAEDIKEILGGNQGSTTPIQIEIETVEGDKLTDFSAAMKTILKSHNPKEWLFNINATAGLSSWQLLSYFITMQYRDRFVKFFVIRKDTSEILEFPFKILTNSEQIICSCLGEGANTVDSLKRCYQQKTKKESVSNSFISKYMSSLENMGLIKEHFENRKKIFELTKLGRFYY